MPSLLIYFLKTNTALVLIYLAYHFFLRHLTFHKWNRFFLIFGICFSVALPFINIFKSIKQQHVIKQSITSITLDLSVLQRIPAEVQSQVPSIWQLVFIVLLAGSALIFTQIFTQFLSLYLLHRRSSPYYYADLPYRQVDDKISPFSFWQSVYLNHDQHPHEELVQILHHELIHVRQRHTLDVLLCELIVTFCWFNPGAWLLREAVKENLEFITDREILRKGWDRKFYQYSLIRVSNFSQSISTINNFNFHSIKKRIATMNKQPSSPIQFVRYTVIVPLMAILTLLFTIFGTEHELSASIVQAPSFDSVEQPQLTSLYFIDGEKVSNKAVAQLNINEIHSMDVLKGVIATEAFGERNANGFIAITTKANRFLPHVVKFTERVREVRDRHGNGKPN